MLVNARRQEQSLNTTMQTQQHHHHHHVVTFISNLHWLLSINTESSKIEIADPIIGLHVARPSIIQFAAQTKETR
jgi:hypothetical protein